ncbi:MAG: Phosphoribosylglycinamide formyltransferase [Naasia sp.]|nr:Phosphoribosylglycinamide formyltransferase [Naasia sp.]
MIYPRSVLLLPDADTRLALLEDPRGFVPGCFAPGWMGVNRAAAEPDRDWLS